MEWLPGVPLAIQPVKEAVLRWRGGVRYGGAVITVVGLFDTAGGPSVAAPALRLRSVETGQSFVLKPGASAPGLSGLRPELPYRVTGRVIKSGEGKHEEISLEVEQIEPATAGTAPGSR